MTLHEARQRLASVVVSPSLSLTGAVRRLDDAGTGALLVCNDNGTLIGLLTDGDIRRAMLRGMSFQEEVSLVANDSPARNT